MQETSQDYAWQSVAPTSADMTQCVQQWFARSVPLLWRPILSRENFPDIDPAQLIAAQADSGPCWLISRPEDLRTIPAGITGWLMPVDAEDTDVACGRWENSLTFMAVVDQSNGERITYQSDCD